MSTFLTSSDGYSASIGADGSITAGADGYGVSIGGNGGVAVNPLFPQQAAPAVVNPYPRERQYRNRARSARNINGDTTINEVQGDVVNINGRRYIAVD